MNANLLLIIQGNLVRFFLMERILMIIKGLKTMIVGLAIMLLGGFIIVDPTSSSSIGFGIAILGLIIVLYGYYQDE